jgi:dihydrodipicolinate reductase
MKSYNYMNLYREHVVQFFSIMFNKSKIRWWCEAITVSGTIGLDHEKIDNTSKTCRNEIDVPIAKSFACNVYLNSTFVSFEGIQVRFLNRGT